MRRLLFFLVPALLLFGFRAPTTAAHRSVPGSCLPDTADAADETPRQLFWLQHIQPDCAPIKSENSHCRYRVKDTLIENGEEKTFIVEQAAVFTTTTLHLYSSTHFKTGKTDSLLFRVNGKNLVPRFISSGKTPFTANDLYDLAGWVIDTTNIVSFISKKSKLLLIACYDIDHTPGTSQELDLVVDITDSNAPSLTILSPFHWYNTFWNIGDPDGDGRLDIVLCEYIETAYDFNRAIKDSILQPGMEFKQPTLEYGRFTVYPLNGQSPGTPLCDANGKPYQSLFRIRTTQGPYGAILDQYAAVLRENWPQPCTTGSKK